METERLTGEALTAMARELLAHRRATRSVLHVGRSTIQGADLIEAYRERMHALFAPLSQNGGAA